MRKAPRGASGYERAWNRYEFSEMQGSGDTKYWSYVKLDEYDCTSGRMRHVAETYYLGRNLTGKPESFPESPGEWYAVVPGTISQHALNFACGPNSERD